MKNRFSIPEEKCEDSLANFYESVAICFNYIVTEKTRFDCRNICVTPSVMKKLWNFYSAQNLNNEQIATIMLQFGPKASLEGSDYEVEIEDDFITEVT